MQTKGRLIHLQRSLPGINFCQVYSLQENKKRLTVFDVDLLGMVRISYPEVKAQKQQQHILELLTAKTSSILPKRGGQQQKGMLLLMINMSH